MTVKMSGLKKKNRPQLNEARGFLPTAAADRMERRESPHMPWPEVHPF
jgi:hypothetical protein